MPEEAVCINNPWQPASTLSLSSPAIELPYRIDKVAWVQMQLQEIAFNTFTETHSCKYQECLLLPLNIDIS
jgi:hypothetical protein